MRNQNIVATFLIPIKEDEILLSLRKNSGYHDGEYSLLAGHVEKNESYSQAIIREAQEEAGIKVLKSDLIPAHIQHRKSDLDGSERVDAYFFIKKWQGKIRNIEKHKCGGLDWFSKKSLPNNMVPCVRLAITQAFKGCFYSEFGWN
jgi:8-oxo-dGTP diphosphatase